MCVREREIRQTNGLIRLWCLWHSPESNTIDHGKGTKRRREEKKTNHFCRHAYTKCLCWADFYSTGTDSPRMLLCFCQRCFKLMGRHARLKKAISHLEWESSPVDKDAATRPLVSHASHHNKIQESNQQDNKV